MKIYRYGSVCCAFYFSYSVPFILWAFFGQDPKGEYVAMQIALMPAFLLLMSFRLINLIEPIAWLNSYFVFYLLSFWLAYLVGSTLEFVITKAKERRMAAYVDDRKDLRAREKRSHDIF